MAKEILHPVIALWRTIGQNMSVREFREWYRGEDPEERLGMARLAADELGCELEQKSPSTSLEASSLRR